MFHIRVNSCVANISDITFRTKSTSRKKLELCHYRISRSVNKIFSQSPLNSLQKACTCNWNWVHILNQQLHVRFTTYCLVIKCITLYSAKYKKKFSNLRHGKMPLFTVLLFHTPRLAENLKIFSINSWKSAQCMFYIRLMCLHQTTEEYYNIPFDVRPGQWSHSGKGHVMCWMLSKNETVFWFVLKKY